MEVLPASNEEYGTQAYWEARYQNSCDQAFDWFKTWTELRDVLLPLLPDKQSRIVMLGCGNSTLSQDMYDEGFRNICNLDYSPACIESMKQMHADHRPEMEWLVGDVRDLKEHGTDTFDVAIDKGTMDAMMTRKHDVWNPPEDMVRDCRAEVSEALRLLKPDGVFIYVTFAQPHFRKRMLQFDGYDLKTTTMGDGMSYFVFTLRKQT